MLCCTNSTPSPVKCFKAAKAVSVHLGALILAVLLWATQGEALAQAGAALSVNTGAGNVAAGNAAAGNAATGSAATSNAQAVIAPGLAGTAVSLVPNNTSAAWDLRADFYVELPYKLAELARSTPLYFVLDWRMNRPRWYWRDERLVQGQLSWRLSHNPLTQQWRISSSAPGAGNDGRFALSFNTLNEALSNLRRIRREALVQSTQLQANQKYTIAVRLRLDTTQLPKPFQINAITNDDWALDSGILEHSFIAAAPVSVMLPVPAK
jgi:Domain of unknown function (DUF4390)